MPCSDEYNLVNVGSVVRLGFIDNPVRIYQVKLKHFIPVVWCRWNYSLKCQ
jgi:hypothetical protein